VRFPRDAFEIHRPVSSAYQFRGWGWGFSGVKRRVGTITVSDPCQKVGVEKGVRCGTQSCVHVCLVIEEENRVIYFLP
jgi:hypothetical protein